MESQCINTGIIIPLAWPDTVVWKANSWYDYPASLLGILKNNYYKVGHAAVLIISKEDKTIRYFDFGRYHTPLGYGRVRDHDTDPELTLKTKAVFDNDELINIREIMRELESDIPTHGDGKCVFSVSKNIEYHIAWSEAKRWQNMELVKYGPLVLGGTNCSRFVASVMVKCCTSLLEKLLISRPYILFCTPVSNVKMISKDGMICTFHEGKLSSANSKTAQFYNLLKRRWIG